MIVKYLNTDYYYASTNNAGISNSTLFDTGLTPVLIADVSEFNSFIGNVSSLNVNSMKETFELRTGIDPTSIYESGFFVDEQSFLGFSHYGSCMPLPSLKGYPLGSNIPSTSRLHAKIGNYYYNIGNLYGDLTGVGGVRTSEWRNLDGSIVASGSGGYMVSGMLYNNTRGNRSQCYIPVLRQNNNSFDALGYISYEITGDNSGSYVGGAVTYSGATLNILNSFEYIDPVIPPTDPYANAGDSATGGGGGSWDDGSDPVGVPSLPSVGATNTGFISLFVPSQSQLKSVAEYMWGGLFDLSTWKRLFEDPMDCILGLSVVPVSVPTSGSANITVGNIELSGISLPVASQQYVEVDCGSLTVSPYFGSYLDYEPYTKMSLFVPYSGVHTVNADDIMGKTVNLVYHIDILTGSLVAFLKCGDSVLYEFNGACSSNIPVNSMNYASTIENAIRIATNIGTTVATAGASAPLSAGTEATKTAQNVARGISLAGSTADGALSLKPNIDRAGSLGGTTGLLGNQTPYFIVTRPRLCKPKDQNKIKGYPAFINYSVSDLVGKGYTEFDTILLKNLYLTDDEKNELESILMGGVYL